MDDFLHNLRSGKLKQPDRSNRQYGDQQYKGGPRRNMNVMDRRKRDADNRDSSDRLNVIKELLDNFTKSQKRLAEAYEARIAVEERKAQALEILAKNIYRMFNPNTTDADDLLNNTALPVANQQERVEIAAVSPGETAPEIPQPLEVKPVSAEAKPEEISPAAATALPAVEKSVAGPSTTERLNETDRKIIITQIRQKRDNGESWEQIARWIAERGYPTISGKGSWRGIMVKNLYEKSSV